MMKLSSKVHIKNEKYYAASKNDIIAMELTKSDSKLLSHIHSIHANYFYEEGVNKNSFNVTAPVEAPCTESI